MRSRFQVFVVSKLRRLSTENALQFFLTFIVVVSVFNLLVYKILFRCGSSHLGHEKLTYLFSASNLDQKFPFILDANHLAGNVNTSTSEEQKKILDNEDLTSFLPSEYRMSINVITYDRPESLKRLYHSLLNSYYFNHRVNINFFVEAGADDETMRFILSVVWPYGDKTIRHRAKRGGLVVSIVESWYPAHIHDYVMIAEDDVEVSPFWYYWVLRTMKEYRYRTNGILHSNINGISLYTPKYLETSIPRRTYHPYQELGKVSAWLHQIPCSWGEVFFPEFWISYREYFSRRITIPERQILQVPGCECTYWSGSWVKFMIEYMHMKGWFMVYPNFKDETSFSTNHVEPGEHIDIHEAIEKKSLFEVPLFDRKPVFELPNIEHLPLIDYKGERVSRNGVQSAGSHLWNHYNTFLKRREISRNTIPKCNFCTEFFYHINIFSSNSASNLSKLLSSLNSMEAISENFQLTIFIKPSGEQKDSNDLKEKLQIASDYLFAYGTKNIKLPPDPMDHLRTTMSSLGYPSKRDYTIILFDSFHLSEFFFVFIKQTIHTFFGTQKSSELANIAGIGLHPLERFLSTNTKLPQSIRQSKMYYKAQMIEPNFPIVIFPEKWKEFTNWMKQRRRAKLHNFFLPYAKTNKLWGKKWTLHFLKFMVDHSYYMVYPSYGTGASAGIVQYFKPRTQENLRGLIPSINHLIPLNQRLEDMPLFNYLGSCTSRLEIEALQRVIEKHSCTSTSKCCTHPCQIPLFLKNFFRIEMNESCVRKEQDITG